MRITGVAVAILFLVGCADDLPRFGAGHYCQRDDQCLEGLVCVARECAERPAVRTAPRPSIDADVDGRAGAHDAGAHDSGSGGLDAGALDAGAMDAGTRDAGALDAGGPDAGGPADAATDADLLPDALPAG